MANTTYSTHTKLEIKEVIDQLALLLASYSNAHFELSAFLNRITYPFPITPPLKFESFSELLNWHQHQLINQMVFILTKKNNYLT